MRACRNGWSWGPGGGAARRGVARAASSSALERQLEGRVVAAVVLVDPR